MADNSTPIKEGEGKIEETESVYSYASGASNSAVTVATEQLGITVFWHL